MKVHDLPEASQAAERPQRLEPLPGKRPEGAAWDPEAAVRAASYGELHEDLLSQGVERLFGITTWVAVTCGLSLVLIRFGGSGPPRPTWLVEFAWMTSLSLLMAVLTRSKRLRAPQVIDLGYVYLFALCLLLGMARHAAPWTAPVSSMALAPSVLPILAFATLIPAKPRSALATSVGAALMDPLAAFFTGRQQQLSASQVLFLASSPLLAAGIGYAISRVLHRLNESIAEAREVGSYQLVSRLGVGGMAEVWRADHRMLARPAAVKLIRPEVLSGHGPEASARLIRIFLREARVTANLNSPHTIQLYDFGVTREGSLYYVMELLHGLDLKQLVDRFGPVPPERAAYLLRQICQSLSEAHAHDLVHRDIKPANVFTCEYGGEVDFVKVLDFGLVLDRHPTAEELEDEKHFVGTPAVMAPEMVRFQAPVDARADIYSVGCVAYWLLTGERVFEAQTRHDMLIMHAHQKPLRPSKRLGRAVHPALEDVVMQCLEKNPDRRPQTARELAEMLELLHFETPWNGERARLWWRRERPTEEAVEPAADRAGAADVDSSAQEAEPTA